MVIRALSAVLRKRSCQANRNTEHYERLASGSQSGEGEILQRIRTGHRQKEEKGGVPEDGEEVMR